MVLYRHPMQGVTDTCASHASHAHALLYCFRRMEKILHFSTTNYIADPPSPTSLPSSVLSRRQGGCGSPAPEDGGSYDSCCRWDACEEEAWLATPPRVTRVYLATWFLCRLARRVTCTGGTCDLYWRDMWPVLARHVTCTGETCDLYWRDMWPVLAGHVTCTGGTCDLYRRDMWPVLARRVTCTGEACDLYRRDVWPVRIG